MCTIASFRSMEGVSCLMTELMVDNLQVDGKADVISVDAEAQCIGEENIPEDIGEDNAVAALSADIEETQVAEADQNVLADADNRLNKDANEPKHDAVDTKSIKGDQKVRAKQAEQLHLKLGLRHAWKHPYARQ